jgi:hypothetical protein
MDGSNKTCPEFLKHFNRDLHPYQTLSLLVPTNDTVWTERTTAWYALFTIMISVLAILYLVVGVISVILLVRRDCLRLGTRTFFAVYLSMAILGFSRAALFILDPFGIFGYISDHFDAWIIVSRFLAVAGFPSLVAACTLIILTLFKLVNAKQGRQWYERWINVLILLVFPYIPAVTAEALSHINSESAVFSGLVCETFFVFWGLSICILFLCAGTRLLNALKINQRKATRVSEGHPTLERPGKGFINQNDLRERKTRRIARKITVITFGTAITGILYSLAAAGAVVMVLLLNFMDCMGFRARTSSELWLAIQFGNFLTEILFAGFILYSMTDVSLLLSFLKLLLCWCFRSSRSSSPSNSSSPESTPDTVTGTFSPEEGRIEEDGGGMTIQNQYHCADTVIEEQLQENRFTIQTKNHSDSSIESEEQEEEQPMPLTPLRDHPGRRSPDDDTEEERRTRPTLPLNLDTISKVLSIPEPLVSKPKPLLTRTRGSDPTFGTRSAAAAPKLVPDRKISLNVEMPLRNYKSQAPTYTKCHTPYRPHKMSPLTTPPQSYGTVSQKPYPPHPLLPKPFTEFERQKNT